MSYSLRSAVPSVKFSRLTKLAVVGATFLLAMGCVGVIANEDMGLHDDAGVATGVGSSGAAGGTNGTGTNVGTTGATGSGPTTASGAGGSAGSGPTGSGGSGGSSGIGVGAGGSGGSARPDGGMGGSTGGGGSRDAGIEGATGRDSGVVGGVTFSSDVRPIIQRRCSSCHSFSTYATFTTHSVGQCGGDVLAKANDPANSGFLELVQGQCGAFLMPRGCSTAPCIPQSEIDTVTSWIRAGAPNN
jgi:hypothetical protein